MTYEDTNKVVKSGNNASIGDIHLNISKSVISETRLVSLRVR